jgi:hypothetical protein
MQYVNLTPHAVNIINEDGISGMEYPSSGVARIATQVTGETDGITSVAYGALSGLPEPAEGVTYIVSLVCLLALQGTRPDVVAPWSEVRDDADRIIGCRGLHRLA